MFRSIEEKDIPRLTEICQRGMEYDIFCEALVREKTIGARDFEPELSLVEVENGVIRGFIQGVMGQRQRVPHGWFRLLVVEPAYRGQGIGTELLAEIERRLKARGARRISTMDSVPNYFMPGVDYRYTEAYCFLSKHGYKWVRENINLICDVAAEKFEVTAELKQLRKQGFTIKRAEGKDLAATLKFLRQEFPSWEGEVTECFANQPISLHICIYKGKVVGFSAYEGNNKGTGWFGPMGVLKRFRDKGIGAVLCKLCLQDIARQGFKKSIIPWVGPIRFYSKVCNAKIDRIFWVWEKEL